MSGVSDSLVSSLESYGVRSVMGVIGGSIMPLYDALYRSGDMEVFMFRHEQGAVHAADAYGRLTGKPPGADDQRTRGY